MNYYNITMALALAGLLTACSPADQGQQENAAPTGAATEAAADAGKTVLPDYIKAAVDNPARPDTARQRDAGRRPGEVIEFFGIKPGMRILEMAAGGGYYSQILDSVVGPEGRLIAQNSPGKFYEERIKGTFEPLVAGLHNTEAMVARLATAELAPNSLDGVVIILIYHHMHYNKDQGEKLPDGTVALLNKFKAALKPGGFIGIVEHAAPDDYTRAASAPLHRVPPPVVRADLTGLGFELAAESDILMNDTDDRSKYWRESTPRGQTARLVMKFVKPAN